MTIWEVSSQRNVGVCLGQRNYNPIQQLRHILCQHYNHSLVICFGVLEMYLHTMGDKNQSTPQELGTRM